MTLCIKELNIRRRPEMRVETRSDKEKLRITGDLSDLCTSKNLL